VTDRSVTYEFRGKFDNLRSGLTTMGRSVDDFGAKLLAADAKGAKMRAGLTHFGDLGGRIALGAAAGLAAIVGVTANFDHSMSLVQAATGETADGMQKLRDAALKAGADTAFSASEAADAITALSKAGVSTNDILSGGLNGSLSLAAAGELDVAQAAEIAATTMTQFGLAGQDVGHIADVLAAAAGKAQGEVTDMADALNYVGPVANQMGISLEETAGSIAELASQGILGSQAGTSLRGMLTSLTSPSHLAKETMDQYGISLYDTQGNMIGFRGIAEQLQASMGNLDNKTRDQALGQIFGNEQITAARILYAGGAQDVDKWTKAVDDQGFAADQAATKMDNLSGDFEQLRGSLETALIGAGEDSQGPLRKLLQTLTKVTNAFNDLPGPAKTAVTGLLGITTVLGGGLWFTSKVINGIYTTKKALSDLGITAEGTGGSLRRMSLTAGKLFSIAGAITAIGAAIASSTDNNLDLSDLDRDLQAIINGQGKETLDQIVKSVQNIALLGDPLEATGEAVRDTLGTVVTFGQFDKTGIDRAQDDIKALDDALAGLVESGNADQAYQILDQITFALAQGGGDTSVLLDNLGSFNTAAANARAEGEGAAKSVDKAGNATQRAGKKAASAAPQFEKMSKAMKDARSSAHDTAEEFFGLGDKVDKAKVSLNGWIRDLRKQADALRNFRENAQQAAKKGLDDGLIASLEKAGPAGALRMKQLANATQSEITRANKAWRAGQAEVEKYTNFVGGVPKRVSTDVKVTGTPDAIRQVNGLVSALANVHDKTAYIKTVFSRVNVTAEEHQADGGTVGGQRHPYGDKVITALAPGEEVISNRYGQADRFRADRAAGRIPGYADGGTVTLSTYLRGQTQTRSHDDDTSRQARETAQALKGLKARLQEATKSLEAEQKQRDALVDKMKSLGSTVSGGLQTSLFANLDPWSSGSIFGSAETGLRGDIANAQHMKQAIRALKSKGLTGAALAYVLSEGGLAGAQAFAEESGGELREFAHLFNVRSRVTREVGQQAGHAAFGAAFRSEAKQLREVKAEVVKLRHAVQAADHRNDKNHEKDRDAQKKGASNAQRSKRPD
jgi:TP901 family phage tail tape measure protein